MIIKYCPKCAGRPYTIDSTQEKCPKCRTKLQLESAEEEELEDRACFDELVPPKADPADELIEQLDDDGTGNYEPGASEPAPEKCGILRGRVSNYSCTTTDGSGYRRLGITKLWQLLALGQSTEDVLHRFTLWTQCGDEQIPITVNIHGSASTGASIRDNTELLVEGKMHGGIFYARKLSAVHNSTLSPINFQKNFSTIKGFMMAMVIAALALFVICNYGISSIWEWIKVTAIVFLVLSLAYIVLSVTKIGIVLRLIGNSNKGFPWKTILVVSMFLAVFAVGGLFNNLGYATGASISALINALKPVLLTGLVLCVILYLLYRIIKP